MDNRVVPVPIVHLVDEYAERELFNARKYDNRQPLDESGIHGLHRLAAEIYAAGFIDGEGVATQRAISQRQRAFDAESAAQASEGVR
ncbi:MAG: hypothetical protein E6R06_31060 [Mycobacterium sp.]|jgi:hypothetical protein|nr:MAG: hypothetical protein E6R06_31060 [Mycobacterium sp.]